ncbi:MAG TPA: aldo/keto reductase [Niabella sp.]|nr:aldo/keto reductase [Niabella sp.]
MDTAQAYGNERGIGEGLKACSIKREDLFITTKLVAEVKSYNDAVASIANSLKLLGLDYIDLMIIHSPKPWAHYEKENRHFDGNREAWRALEDAYKAGKIRSIGVSNFQIIDIENIVAGCKVKPMVNQILAHISNTPFELIDYCKQNNILVEAYSPIAHGELLKNEQVVKMAEKYGVSVPQLAIRYCLDLGLLPLPKTTNPKNMKNNADVDFEISANDLEILKNIEPIKNYGEASNFPVFWK